MAAVSFGVRTPQRIVRITTSEGADVLSVKREVRRGLRFPVLSPPLRMASLGNNFTMAAPSKKRADCWRHGCRCIEDQDNFGAECMSYFAI